jgi:acyl transferase domain-containing protein
MTVFLFPRHVSQRKGMRNTLLDHTDDHKTRKERRSSDVAIIGISGRFAGSANLEAFWDHLQEGHSCIEEIKRKGWETNTNLDPEHSNTSQVKWGGMLEHIDQFDPLFFNISPLEAARMDPQQRLFLEEAYKSFEDAGYSAEQLSEQKVGVFVGARPSDYKELRRDRARLPSAQEDQTDAHFFLGNDMGILAARISYFLNCKGPSLAIDTTSSSSLVSIHLACESIRTGESEMALAGGVFIMSLPEYAMMAAKAQMLSPDGKCKTFDKSANGIVLGEGVGALVLKPLDAALEGGDHIYGVIKGSAMNQDGKTFGMTAPSMLSQKVLLSDLYKKAAIHPETVSYIEAHGTGSKLGDPIEVQALTDAFRMFTAKKQFCAIGSHKPNIGHTVSSAGVAGVLKVLLAMKYQQLPPTIIVEEINPQIDWQSSPFFLNTEIREWKRCDGSPRRAGVSSFGLSGTNCHLILEEPPLNKKTADEQARSSFFFPFSAKTKAALAQKVEDMIKWLEKEGEKYSVEDISYTLVQGRSHFPVRSAVVARDTHDLLHALREIHRLGESENNVENEKGRCSQTEPLLQKYGDWLLQELQENALLDQEKLASLVDLYVKGYHLDWGTLFKKGRYQRIPLPTYPFLGESYWIAETPKDQTESVLKSHASAPLGTASEQERRDSALCLSRDKPQPFGVVPTERLRETLSHMVSHLLKVPVEQIDAQTPLSEYGFDSITFTEFANRLNQSYQLDLTPTHFFEYSTLSRLTQYLHATYVNLLAPHFAAPVAPEVMTDEVSPGSSSLRQHARIGHSAVSPTRARAEPIAIIGMSGCFPQAPDVQSLWSNLLEGKDCIGEIPASRWDWQTYFGNPVTPNPNKTNVKWAGIVEDVELFDPLFFGISPHEVEQMDPHDS